MRRYKQALLNHLENRTGDRSEEPLKNIKDSLGSLRHVEGNPLFKAEINIEVTTTIVNDVAGIIAPALLPVALQTQVPVYIFGLTDYYSAFEAMRRVAPITPPFLPGTAIIGQNNFGIWQINRNASPVIPNNYTPGDLILTYQAGVPPFGIGDFYEIEIRIHCNAIGYGTFLNSLASDLMVVNNMRLIVPAANINQYENPLMFAYRTLFGKLKIDSIDPRMYQTPNDFQNQIADIPVTFPIDKNMMLGFQLNVFCQQINFQFFIKKVEPLTFRLK